MISSLLKLMTIIAICVLIMMATIAFNIFNSISKFNVVNPPSKQKIHSIYINCPRIPCGVEGQHKAGKNAR